MKTNEELAIEITSLFDDGFSTKTEFAEGVLDLYTHLERNDFTYVLNILSKEIDARDIEDIYTDDLMELSYEVKLKEKFHAS